MNFTQFSESRKSTRGFQDKPVPKDVVEEIINTAKWAPTSYNTQTWHIHAVAGDVLDKIREGNTKNTLAASRMFVISLTKKTTREGIGRTKSMSLFNYLRPWALSVITKKNAWIGC